jgi:hypothetical protein
MNSSNVFLKSPYLVEGAGGDEDSNGIYTIAHNTEHARQQCGVDFVCHIHQSVEHIETSCEELRTLHRRRGDSLPQCSFPSGRAPHKPSD